MKIILNGQEVEVHDRVLSYDRIAAMVYQPTVTYSRGPKSKPEGIIHKDMGVKVVEGMIIDCMRTGAA